MLTFSRRDCIRFIPTLVALGFMPKALFAGELLTLDPIPGHSSHNFKYIYTAVRLTGGNISR